MDNLTGFTFFARIEWSSFIFFDVMTAIIAAVFLPEKTLVPEIAQKEIAMGNSFCLARGRR